MITIDSSLISGATIRGTCGAPAPLVVNGAHFAGCALDVGHDGPHSLTVEWTHRGNESTIATGHHD